MKEFTGNLDVTRGEWSVLIAIFVNLDVLLKAVIAWLVRDDRRLNENRKRIGRLAWVNAGISIA